MNKQSIIIIIILLVLGLLGVYMLVSNGRGQPQTQVDQEQTAMQQEGDEQMQMDLLDPVNYLPEAPEGVLSYDISSGLVSYTAQKRFFNQPDAEVIGSTDNIKGLGWYDPETNSFALAAYLDYNTIATDNEKRDVDVQKMFTDSNVLIMVEVQEEDSITLNEEVNLQIPVLLTINGMQRSEVFDVTATVTEEGFEATGQTSVLMSDFGINPPSLADVFTVDDEIVLSFEINGDSTSETSMMTEEETMMETDATTDETVMIEEDGTSADTNMMEQ